MKLDSTELINELSQLTIANKAKAEELLKYTEEELNKKASEQSWSALECIEHLNRYGDFYIPEISMKMEKSESKSQKSNAVFKSNWLGNYFSNSMKYKEKLNTMKTFSSMNPSGSSLKKSTLEKFISQQVDTIELLNRAKNINLTKTKTGITISQWIKLRLGDTFRVVIYHNERHLIQAEKAVK